MKHNKIFLLITITIMLLTCIAPVSASTTISNTTYPNLSSLQSSYSDAELSNSQGGPYYLVVPYSQGFDYLLDLNGQQYKMRVRSIEMEQANAGPIEIGQYLATVVPGYSYTMSETYTDSTSNTISFSTTATLSTAFKILEQGIDAKITQSYTNSETHVVTYTVSEGQTFSFPSYYYPEYSSVDFYMGFTYDKYKVTLDYIPIINIYSPTGDIITDIEHRVKVEVRPPREGGGYTVTHYFVITLENGTILTLSQSEFNNLVVTVDGDMITEEGELLEPRGTIISIPQ